MFEEDGNYCHVAMLVDAFTKQIKAGAIPNKSADEVAMFLWEKLYCEVGTPGNCMVQDRGDELWSEITKSMHKFFQTEIRFTTAGNKQSNGQAERYFRTMKDRLAACQNKYKDGFLPRNWTRTLLPAVVFGINSSVSSAHGQVPLELTMGRPIYTPFDITNMDLDAEEGSIDCKEKFI